MRLEVSCWGARERALWASSLVVGIAQSHRPVLTRCIDALRARGDERIAHDIGVLRGPRPGDEQTPPPPQGLLVDEQLVVGDPERQSVLHGVARDGAPAGAEQ